MAETRTSVRSAPWLPWALATPLVVGLARQYPIIRGISVRTLAVHLAAFATLSAVAETWSAWLQVLFNPWGNRKWSTFLDTWSTKLIFQALTFLIRARLQILHGRESGLQLRRAAGGGVEVLVTLPFTEA